MSSSSSEDEATVISVVEATLYKGTAEDSDKPTAQRIFYIIFDNQPADWDAITNAAGLPAKGDRFKPGDGRFLKKKTPAQLGDKDTYIVTCDYETTETDYTLSPLDQPDLISGDFTNENKPYFMDFSSTPKPVVNSSYEPFDKNPENKVGYYQFCVRGNRADIDPVTWGSYFFPACAYNSSAVTIRGKTFPEKTLLTLGLRHSEQTQNGTRYHEVEWNLGVGPDWSVEKIDDRGYTYTYIDDDGDLVSAPILDGNTPQAPVKSPWPLDGDGNAADDPTVTPAVLTFAPQPGKDFSIFGWTP